MASATENGFAMRSISILAISICIRNPKAALYDQLPTQIRDAPINTALPMKRRYGSIVFETVQRAFHRAEVLSQHMRVYLRCFHIDMAEQLLHHPDIGSRFQQMRGE